MRAVFVIGRFLPVFLVLLGIAGCREDGEQRQAGEPAPLRVVYVTHGQSSDPFWSVVSNGARAAGGKLGVEVEYQAPLTFDMVEMANLIEGAVASRPDGLVVSIPDPAALGRSIGKAIEADLPVVSINSGAEAWERIGTLAHVGQPEYEAGRTAGERMAGAGVRIALCVNHEVGNAALDRRCSGFGDALSAAGGEVEVLAVELADPAETRERVARAVATRPDLDGLLTLGPTGAAPVLAALREEDAIGEIAFATFDLSPEVLRAVADGEMLFALDQQPYLQGYLPVVFLAVHAETRAIPGGGRVVRTGPRFVTEENADEVIDLAAEGVR
ncbi:MAG: sugar ABC transporter substrate-binding protein [Gemmatimonadota bacterium]|nr:sugar ABC transporter substrate-binding protein [Gemmatimonadota bacterium]